MKTMKQIVFLLIISTTQSYFNGCPMDGCESTLSHFVDLSIDGFHTPLQWSRTDLIKQGSRGCVSNDQSSLICAIDGQYASINVTNGQVRWSIYLKPQKEVIPYALPIINYAGFSIIANDSQCTLIDPKGSIIGTFEYQPILKTPLAGPIVTDDGQIIVADTISFVGIEDSGVPLGVQSLPMGFTRQSRSMSLMRSQARWYLIVESNTSSSQAIVAAETSGSIVSRIRIAWVFNYGEQLTMCTGIEGPLLSEALSLLFVLTSKGIVGIQDNGDSAQIKFFIEFPQLCPNDVAYSEIDSMLIIIDRNSYDIFLVNVTNQSVGRISLQKLYPKQIVGQISKMTILQNQRLIISFSTSERRAVILLVDFKRQMIVANLDLGPTVNTQAHQPLTQLAYTETDDKQLYVIIAHPSIGLVGVRLVTNDPPQKRMLLS